MTRSISIITTIIDGINIHSRHHDSSSSSSSHHKATAIATLRKMLEIAPPMVNSRRQCDSTRIA